MQRRDHGPQHGPPSQAAQDRLARGLADEIAEFKVRLSEAQLRSEALEAAGCREAAVEAVDEQRELLAELEQRMEAVISAATVEREAEAVVADALVEDEREEARGPMTALAGSALAALVALLLGFTATTGGVRLTGAGTDGGVSESAPGRGSADETAVDVASARDVESDPPDEAHPAVRQRQVRRQDREPRIAGDLSSGPPLALHALLTQLFGLPSSLAGDVDSVIGGVLGGSVRDGWEAAATERTLAEQFAGNRFPATDGEGSGVDGQDEATDDSSETSPSPDDEARTGTREGAPSGGESEGDGASPTPDDDSGDGGGDEPGSDPDTSSDPLSEDLGGTDPGVGDVGPSGD